MTIKHNPFLLHYSYEFKMLKLIGIWIDTGSGISSVYWYYFFTVNLLFAFLFNFCQLMYLYQVSSSLRSFAASGYIILISLMGNVKSYYIFKYRKHFTELIVNMDCEEFVPRNNKQNSIVNASIQFWKNLGKVLLVIGTITLTFSLTTPLFKNKNDLELPFASWYPFDVYKSVVYELVYMHQCIAVVYISFTNMYVDIVTTGFLTFIGIQCDLLCENLENMTCIEEYKNKFQSCIKQHWKILRFSKTFEEVFGNIIFGQFVAVNTALCMALFLLTIKINTYDFLYLMFYQLAIFNLLLIPCWFASETTSKSENIPFAIYQSSWFDIPMHMRKDVGFFILRAQKPIKIYAINFFQLSLETFVLIVRSSFSYFAMLSNLNE